MNGIIAQYISQKLALTKSYGRSIGKLIDNSKNAAKQFNINKPPSCSCKFVKMLSSNVGLLLDHCWVKATEVEDPYFLSVFRMATNSIPNPYLATVSFDINNYIAELVAGNCVDVNTENANISEYLMLGGKDLDTTFINEHLVRELAHKLKHCVISIRIYTRQKKVSARSLRVNASSGKKCMRHILMMCHII